jgi:hypothetical protein
MPNKWCNNINSIDTIMHQLDKALVIGIRLTANSALNDRKELANYAQTMSYSILSVMTYLEGLKKEMQKFPNTDLILPPKLEQFKHIDITV